MSDLTWKQNKCNKKYDIFGLFWFDFVHHEPDNAKLRWYSLVTVQVDSIQIKKRFTVNLKKTFFCHVIIT